MAAAGPGSGRAVGGRGVQRRPSRPLQWPLLLLLLLLLVALVGLTSANMETAELQGMTREELLKMQAQARAARAARARATAAARASAKSARAAFLASPSIAAALGWEAPPRKVHVPMDLTVVAVGFRGDGAAGLRVDAAELQRWLDHLEASLPHRQRAPLAGEAAAGEGAHAGSAGGAARARAAAAAALGHVGYNVSVHVLLASEDVTDVVDLALRVFARPVDPRPPPAPERGGSGDHFSRFSWDAHGGPGGPGASEDAAAAAAVVPWQVDAAQMSALLESLQATLGLADESVLFLLNPNRPDASDAGASGAGAGGPPATGPSGVPAPTVGRYGYREGLSSAEAAELRRLGVNWGHVAARLVDITPAHGSIATAAPPPPGGFLSFLSFLASAAGALAGGPAPAAAPPRTWGPELAAKASDWAADSVRALEKWATHAASGGHGAGSSSSTPLKHTRDDPADTPASHLIGLAARIAAQGDEHAMAVRRALEGEPSAAAAATGASTGARPGASGVSSASALSSPPSPYAYEGCLVDAWVAHARRTAWLDLTAGPLGWGPVAGSGAHSPDAVPRPEALFGPSPLAGGGAARAAGVHGLTPPAARMPGGKSVHDVTKAVDDQAARAKAALLQEVLKMMRTQAATYATLERDAATAFPLGRGGDKPPAGQQGGASSAAAAKLPANSAAFARHLETYRIFTGHYCGPEPSAGVAPAGKRARHARAAAGGDPVTCADAWAQIHALEARYAPKDAGQAAGQAAGDKRAGEGDGSGPGKKAAADGEGAGPGGVGGGLEGDDAAAAAAAAADTADADALASRLRSLIADDNSAGGKEPEESTPGSDALLSGLAHAISGFSRAVLVPAAAPGRYRPHAHVQLVLYVLRAQGRYRPTSAAHFDPDAFTAALAPLSLGGTQALKLSVQELSLADHPGLAVAYASALRTRGGELAGGGMGGGAPSEAEGRANAGTGAGSSDVFSYGRHEGRYLDSSALRSHLAYLHAGPAHTAAGGVRTRPTGAGVSEDAAEAAPTLEVPIFLFSMDEDPPVFLDRGAAQALALPDMVLVAQNAQRAVPAGVACAAGAPPGPAGGWGGAGRLARDGRRPLAAAVAAVAEHIGGLLPAHLSTLDGEVATGGGGAGGGADWGWAVGAGALSDTAAGASLGPFAADAVARGFAAGALGAAAAHLQVIAGRLRAEAPSEEVWPIVRSHLQPLMPAYSATLALLRAAAASAGRPAELQQAWRDAARAEEQAAGLKAAVVEAIAAMHPARCLPPRARIRAVATAARAEAKAVAAIGSAAAAAAHERAGRAPLPGPAGATGAGASAEHEHHLAADSEAEAHLDPAVAPLLLGTDEAEKWRRELMVVGVGATVAGVAVAASLGLRGLLSAGRTKPKLN